MEKREFVHLHLHTDYSLLDGAIQIQPLAKRLSELGMQSCAITDHGNLFGAMSFYRTLTAEGIKPIIGCEMYLTLDGRHNKIKSSEPGEKTNHHIILLAKDLEGYQNLVQLSSRAFTEGFYYKPRIDCDLLASHSRGLIGLSACVSGVPAAMLARNQWQRAVDLTLQFSEILGKGNYFLEIQDHELEVQKRIRQDLVRLSKHTDIPLVVSNDAHYLSPEDYKAHDILLCIGSGKTIDDPKRLRYGSPYFYVRSADEMWKIFGSELPDALRRTIDIAEMCDLKFPDAPNLVPPYRIPAEDDHLSVDDYLNKVVLEGFEIRLKTLWERKIASNSLKRPLSDYRQRVSEELEVIKRMQYSSYFLIVWDFIKHARKKGIPVGPGRGSAAGSLVAYCLEITDVDPLEYDLLFERFLNPERVSMPDIDIDFCVRGRDEVIRHVKEAYGHDSVCQIITFGTMASRAAIKDVGRALNMPYGDVERIAKLIPPPVRGRNVSISQALEQVGELRDAFERNPAVKNLIDLARRLEGCARHASVHAAGVVISPKPLEQVIPIAVSPRQELTTQYDMSDLEHTGVLKMDFLGLTALTVIDECIKSLKSESGVEINWPEISLDDPETMSIFEEGRTDAIFQFESSGMQEICRRLKPKGLEDLAALNALYRPGPIDGGMIDEFIQRYHGKKAVTYISPEIEDILSSTYGIIVYQEQIMNIAQRIAGYSLSQADLMRRAMGKKDRDKMAQEKERFITGAVAHGLSQNTASQIFHLMEQFADYGFNRSHSVAYAYLAFQTAYLKAHFPEHFFSAVLSSEAEDSSKVQKYAGELKSLRITLLPPDVNESDAAFRPSNGAIRYGLSALKGLGQSAVDAILEARSHSRFTSLLNFTERVSQKSLNRRVLESLICAGAFDCFSSGAMSASFWRAQLFAQIEAAMSYGNRAQRARACGQNDLFSSVSQAETTEAAYSPAVTVEPWTESRLWAGEKGALGFYVSGHPIQNYLKVLHERNCIKSDGLIATAAGSSLKIAGVLVSSDVRTNRKGEEFCIARFDDEIGEFKVVARPQTYAKCKHNLVESEPLLLSGRLDSAQDSEPTIILDEAVPLADTVLSWASSLVVRVPFKEHLNSLLQKLWQVLATHQGSCEVRLEVELEDGMTVVTRIQNSMRVRASVDIDKALRDFGCSPEWIQ